MESSTTARWTFALGLALLLAVVLSSSAFAVTDSEEFARIGSRGAGAGELGIPRDIATDPNTGYLYVADEPNRRISVFTPWGDLVKSWGWGVVDGAAELQTCNEATSCQRGSAGAGPGQLAENVLGLAVDGDGNVWVQDRGNLRVQKFDPGSGKADAEFLLMIGGGVNQSTGANLCTAASGDECGGAGTAGTESGQFTAGTGIATDSSGTTYVADQDRIQKFAWSGSTQGVIAIPGETVRSVDVDSTGSFLYVVYADPVKFNSKSNVRKLDASGTLIDQFEVLHPSWLALDPNEHLYVVDQRDNQHHPQSILEFDEKGELVNQIAKEEAGNPESQLTEYTGLGTNTAGDLYVANRLLTETVFVSAYGPPPLLYGDPPPVPPTISSQYVLSGAATEVDLQGEINPHFWPDTTYYVEYGSEPCGVSACSKVPIAPEDLGGGAVDRAIKTAPVELDGLSPSTTYHYRFVAQSGGGGPVHAPDATFTTIAPEEAPAADCPNQVFRVGLSAPLPDCRVYEMVSPVEKASGDVFALIDISGFQNRLNQTSPDGNRLTYSSYRAFAGPKGAPYTSQYLATRSGSGWSSQNLSPAQGPAATFAFNNPFRAFSADLSRSWLTASAEPPLDPARPEPFENLYRRDPDGSFEALIGDEPTRKSEPELQGVSADGSVAVFQSGGKLTEDATAGVNQVYRAEQGELQLVCILPGEVAFAGNCSAGAPRTVGPFENRGAYVENAVSADGSRIYWSAAVEGEVALPGKIYLRLNGSETVKVSETQSSLRSRFWGASQDGSNALFEVTEGAKAGNLYLYELEAEASGLIAPESLGVVASSEDLSRVYFVSEAVLPGTSGATAERPNLYLHEGEEDVFVATLSRADVAVRSDSQAGVPSNVAREPIYRPAHANPDGSSLAFISTEPLTGVDSTDAVSGKADSQVFVYDATADALRCASCDPAGARPHGQNVAANGNQGSLWTAGSIPGASTQLFTPRTLSDDGQRLFFTAFDDLLPRDRNGKADVYEWERPGSGSCEQGDGAYQPVNGGCLYLISTGTSTEDAEFADSSLDGRDVFFATSQSLLPQDPDRIDIYDARVQGGFPPPAPPPVPCEGEACQAPPASAPALQPPASGVAGPGNPPRKATKPKRCPKGKHKVKKNGKTRCVKTKGRAGR